MGEEFLTYTIEQLAPLLRTRKLSPVEVTRACLERAEALNGKLSAYTIVLADRALEQAREAERALARGEGRSLLHGIPLSVKDVFETKDIPTTWGAKALASYRPVEDSTVVVKLRQAGALLIGKTNVDMYPYYGWSDSERLIGPSRNPWDPQRTAGRSSGGSGASVAALMDYGSVGSDAGGSIRIPAALCGVVGLQPTFGLVSKYRVFPYSNSFDHCGPLARSVYDCALLLQTIAGYDRKDPTTVDRPVPDCTGGLGRPVGSLRIGLPRSEANEPEVTRLIDEAVGILSDLGMEMHEISLPYLNDARWWVNMISFLETTAMTEAMVMPAKPLDLLPAYMTARNAAARKRVLDQSRVIGRAIQEAYAEIFNDVDLIITPTVPTTASRIGEDHSPWQRPAEPFAELMIRYTCIFTLIRHPAISIPCGFTTNGMPVGLQIVGRPFEEETVLRTAHAYERATGWHLRHPSIS
jgi:aspartyl-tRNA(Asn)/glutamyl-tRNA(Gln) amidotransferase subunit A